MRIVTKTFLFNQYIPFPHKKKLRAPNMSIEILEDLTAL
jgi:hypothetical protein